MLYVFRVDNGTMLQMDMNLALATVAELKDTIERTCRIAAEKQVLLVSGGECLDLNARVCHYSAGTDTNPIFLFSKNSLENRSISPTADPLDSDITEQVELSLDLPPSYSTVVERAKLAHSLYELGGELARECERLIYDQHLQQQGWAAAVANLEDMAAFFRERSTVFQNDFYVHLETREENLESLKNFNENLQTLSRIPILPPLLASAISLSGLDLETKITTMTLLDWISAKDNQSSLQAVAEQCAAFLQQTDSTVLDSLVRKVEVALEVANKSDMKEIKGLTERLCGLDQLMVRAKKIVADQSDLDQSIQQNKLRASNLGDASILPDLCSSHRRQLLIMLENQTKLKDIRRRCQKAKEELSENLNHRLRWVAFAQNEMQAVGNSLMIYQESLKRGRRHFMIIRQVQRAPEMYCLTVAEVVRRRKFSSAFLRWAADLSNRLLATYNEECERRRDFKMQFGGHFLEALFPGLEDEPSSYATKTPDPFDLYLPNLSEADMEKLRETLPDLALSVSFTELSSVARMLLSKMNVDETKDDLPVEDRLAATVSQIGLSDKMDEALLRADDADDFPPSSENPCCRDSREKSNLLRDTLLAAREATSAAAASLRGELHELRSQSIADRDSIFELVRQIQFDIGQLTDGYDILRSEKCELEVTLSETKLDLEEKRKLAVEKAEREYSDRMQRALEEKDKVVEEIKSVSAKEKENFEEQISELEQRLVKTELTAEIELENRTKELEAERDKICLELEQRLVSDYQLQLEEMKKNNEKALEELTERLAAEHQAELQEVSVRLASEYKTEIGSLRSRFRLMSVTSMEKSPSDLSLEKIERGDMIELTNHEAIVCQLKEDAELAQEKAVAEAVRLEQERSKARLEESIASARARMEEEKQVWLEEAVTRAMAERDRQLEEQLREAKVQLEEERLVTIRDAVAEACSEKDRQLEAMLERQQQLITECQRHRDTIRLLTEGDHFRSGAGTVDPLLERVENLEKERSELLEEVKFLREVASDKADDSRQRRNSQRTSFRESSISEVAETESSSQKSDDMMLSVAVMETSSNVTTSPELGRLSRTKMTRSMRETAHVGGMICLNSCMPDDPVLVIWSVEYSNYMILQDNPTLFFLHADCLDTLGLRPSSDGSPRRMFTPAVVVRKEYCNAKKSENRYRVPSGTKFYRVIVRPMRRERPERQDSPYFRPTDGGSPS